ncbi:alpha/beta hydrolase family protein [Williamsia sp. MIQD14]|uniref:alpha/beta hydrolase family protein n=1 Tax=Williamsia sp. MIQD14 TaxID=3425703 RepID=UPI003DA02A4C
MTRTRRAPWAVLASTVMAGALLVGCSDGSGPTEAIRSPIPVTASPSPHASARGTVVSATPLTDLTPEVAGIVSSAARATYLSVDPVTGAEVRVTGTFLVPRGTPPTGGWPVISYAHGTTGIANGCGLSQSPDLRGYTGTLTALVSAGFAVAATDYRGLGPSGAHLYLEPLSAALDVIDAVRALRRATSTVSTRWLAFGDSQGGQAVWSAAEQQSTLGTGLTLVGALATKPAANVTPVPELAEHERLSAEQRTIAALVAVGAARSSRGALTVAQVLPRIPPDRLAELVGCDSGARSRALSETSAVDMAPNADAVDRYTTELRRQALPQRRSEVPIRVVYGLADQLVPPEWVRSAIDDACALGSPVSARAVPGKGHGDTLLDDTDQQWVTARFAGQPVTGTCR